MKGDLVRCEVWRECVLHCAPHIVDKKSDCEKPYDCPVANEKVKCVQYKEDDE